MLTVIICTYNRQRYIRPLLESIASNTLQKSEYEILLVDNNCTDNTREVCEQFAADLGKSRKMVPSEVGRKGSPICGFSQSGLDMNLEDV